MKIITLHQPVSQTALFGLLNNKVNPLFKEQRQTDVNFIFSNKPDGIEITQPLYEGVLFKIEIKGDELWITRNEHYTDDVNSLALESILNGLFEDLASDLGTDLVQEG